jgi:hypothetical protein
MNQPRPLKHPSAVPQNTPSPYCYDLLVIMKAIISYTENIKKVMSFFGAESYYGSIYGPILGTKNRTVMYCGPQHVLIIDNPH